MTEANVERRGSEGEGEIEGIVAGCVCGDMITYPIPPMGVMRIQSLTNLQASHGCPEKVSKVSNLWAELSL